jgi:hypothetical protein
LGKSVIGGLKDGKKARAAVIDSYWMGMRTIANVLSPETTPIFRGENCFIIPMQTLDVNKCVVIEIYYNITLFSVVNVNSDVPFATIDMQL